MKWEEISKNSQYRLKIKPFSIVVTNLSSCYKLVILHKDNKVWEENESTLEKAKQKGIRFLQEYINSVAEIPYSEFYKAWTFSGDDMWLNSYCGINCRIMGGNEGFFFVRIELNEIIDEAFISVEDAKKKMHEYLRGYLFDFMLNLERAKE